MVHQRGEEEPRRVGVSLDTSAVVSVGRGLHLFLGDPLPLSLFLPPPITGWMTWEDGAGINNI